MKRVYTLVLILLLAFGFAEDQQSYEDAKAKAIELVAKHKEIKAYLKNYADWRGEAWPEDEEAGLWYVDFYSDNADDWLGFGVVNIETKKVTEAFVPKPLDPEVFRERKEKIEKKVLADAEIQARLGDVELWDYDVEYNRYEANWAVYFWRGLEEIAVDLYEDNGKFYISDIYDPNQFEEEEALEQKQNQAIELAYEAKEIELALEGIDNWRSYVEPQGDLWAVEFAVDGERLFTAIVNIDTWEIIGTERP